MARRVFPHPPVPIRLTTRWATRSSCTWAISAALPTNEVDGRGTCTPAPRRPPTSGRQLQVTPLQQDGLLEVAQLWGRLDTELVAEKTPELLDQMRNTSAWQPAR